MKRLYIWYDLDFRQYHIIATSQSDAKKQLLLQGKIAIKVKAGNFITARSFNHSELLNITTQLATMLKAGLSIIDSLNLLVEEQSKPHWQYLMTEIAAQIVKGESLSSALFIHNYVFSSLYCEIIATSEMTGKLDESFEQLASLLEKSIKLQKNLKKAMRYPIFLLSVAIIVSLVMLLFVLPKFADIYRDFDAELPFFTQCIIDIADSLQHSWHIGCIILVGSFLVFQRYINKQYRNKIEIALMKLPFVNKIIQTSCLTQIFQTIAITQKAGIPLLSGLTAAANASYHCVYRNSVLQIISGIEQGHSFSHVLHLQPCFPNLCRQLIHVGEQSGTLDLMLSRLALYYEAQNQTLIENLSQAFEPLLMLVLSVIIGGLIIAIYLPIFQLGEVIQ